jgi:hypothetical protein
VDFADGIIAFCKKMWTLRTVLLRFAGRCGLCGRYYCVLQEDVDFADGIIAFDAAEGIKIRVVRVSFISYKGESCCVPFTL